MTDGLSGRLATECHQPKAVMEHCDGDWIVRE